MEGERNGKSQCNDTEFQFGGEKVLEVASGDDCASRMKLLMPPNVHLQWLK